MALTIAERFLLTRRRMGITQEQLAQMLRVSRRTINRVELAEGRVRRELLERYLILEKRNRHTVTSRRRVSGAKRFRAIRYKAKGKDQSGDGPVDQLPELLAKARPTA